MSTTQNLRRPADGLRCAARGDTHDHHSEGSAVSAFTPNELAFLSQRNLARIATVGKDGTPHVVPVGMWTHNAAEDTIDVRGRDLEKTKKFRDVARSRRAAIVIDDLASIDPFRPRAIEVRGHAETVTDPEVLIRIRPERIISWGTDPDQPGERSARSVS
jgi:pyridoxamine 5'-phosphate oxidase family protein